MAEEGAERRKSQQEAEVGKVGERGRRPGEVLEEVTAGGGTASRGGGAATDLAGNESDLRGEA